MDVIEHRQRPIGRSAGRSRFEALAPVPVAVAIAMVVIVSATASGSMSRATNLIAPYKGSASPTRSFYQTGCGGVRFVTAPFFNLTNGAGGSSATGTAKMCANARIGIGTYSSVSASDQLYVGIAFHPQAGVKHVQANVSTTWSASTRSSDGGKPQCNQGNVYDNVYYSDSWGYTKTPVGNYYQYSNYSYLDRNAYTSGVVTTVTYNNGTSHGTGTAPFPRPLQFNNTSSFGWSHSWGGNAYCQAGASVYASSYAYVIDESNGSYVPMSANTVGASGLFFNMNVLTYNYTSWSCYNSTSWTGPSSSWSNSSLSCNHNNGTVTSITNNCLPPCTPQSNHNNSLVLNNASSVTGQWVWNYTFNSKHHYGLFFYVNANGNAYNTWPQRGLADFVWNMATLGNGLRLTALYMT